MVVLLLDYDLNYFLFLLSFVVKTSCLVNLNLAMSIYQFLIGLQYRGLGQSVQIQVVFTVTISILYGIPFLLDEISICCVNIVFFPCLCCHEN